MHWASVFRDLPDGIVLDVACGAGAVSRHAAAAGRRDLIGIDIAIDAVRVARKNVPTLNGVVARADDIPVASNAVSCVVSQFGLEYADCDNAADEIARVLIPGGVFHAIVHIKSGVIEAECRGHLARIDAIQASQYLPTAKKFLGSVFAFERSPSSILRAQMEKAFKAFEVARTTLKPEILSGGIAAQLHAGVGDRYQRRRQFEAQDTLNWLDGWDVDINAYVGRTQSMLSAAMDEDQARTILSKISPSRRYRIEEFRIDGQIAAWNLSAQN